MNSAPVTRTQNMAEDTRTTTRKVRLFFSAGVVVLVICIIFLGQVHFTSEATYYMFFKNANEVIEKTPVEIAGVELGRVKRIELVGGIARLTISMDKHVRLYKSSRARIFTESLIGHRYIGVTTGHPEPGAPASSQLLRDGDIIPTAEEISANELMERFASAIDQITGGERLSGNFRAIRKNVRSISATLHAALGSHQMPGPREMIQKIDHFTRGAVSFTQRLDRTIVRFSEKAQSMVHFFAGRMMAFRDALTRIQNGEGFLGNLLTNPQAGENLKENISSMKNLSDSAKLSLTRYTHVRTYWNFDARQDFKANVTRYDIGLELDSSPKRFYYVAGENLAGNSTQRMSAQDYEHRNTATVLVGQRWGDLSAGIGMIRSREGVALRYRPSADPHIPILSRLELIAEGLDFRRDTVIKGRSFSHPDYIAGARVHINPTLSVGVQAEDIMETTDWTGLLNISFEDRDVDKLLGFTNFRNSTFGTTQ